MLYYASCKSGLAGSRLNRAAQFVRTIRIVGLIAIVTTRTLLDLLSVSYFKCPNDWIWRKRAVPYGAVLILTLLAGCVTAPEGSPAVQYAWDSRQSILMKLSHWRTAGRIGVINDQEGWHASFQWDQQGANYRIDLIGPLGQGRVAVQGNAETVHIQTQDGQNWLAPNADTLLEQSLNIHLPINGLRYWVRGLPEPASIHPTLQFDADGRLIRLEQNGWIINYLAYMPTQGLDMPARITARRQDLNVKLVIEQWTL